MFVEIYDFFGYGEEVMLGLFVCFVIWNVYLYIRVCY